MSPFSRRAHSRFSCLVERGVVIAATAKRDAVSARAGEIA